MALLKACRIKTTKGRKIVKDKNRNKEQMQKIERSNEYVRY